MCVKQKVSLTSSLKYLQKCTWVEFLNEGQQKASISKHGNLPHAVDVTPAVLVAPVISSFL